MITPRRPGGQPTRERLLSEGVRLFAEKGFRETTVGEIEAAAGLEPRRGGLYRHYPSKEALLESALEQHLRTVAAAGADIELLPPGDIEDQALNLGRWLFAELDREHAIMRILEQDGGRLPALRERFRLTLVEPGYAITAEFARRWLGAASETLDVNALSTVILGALVNYRRSTWTFGVAPAGVDEDSFLTTWAHLCSVTAEALRTRRKPRKRNRPARPTPKTTSSST